MKKRLYLFILVPLLIAGCGTTKDLSDYHLEGEKWSEVVDGLEYFIEYISKASDGAYIKVQREGDFYRHGELDNKMYAYSVMDNTCDYVLVNGKKPKEEEPLGFILPVTVYTVGEQNYAEFFAHSWLKKFRGYAKVQVEVRPTWSDPRHIIYVTLY